MPTVTLYKHDTSVYLCINNTVGEKHVYTFTEDGKAMLTQDWKLRQPKGIKWEVDLTSLFGKLTEDLEARHE